MDLEHVRPLVESRLVLAFPLRLSGRKAEVAQRRRRRLLGAAIRTRFMFAWPPTVSRHVGYLGAKPCRQMETFVIPGVEVRHVVDPGRIALSLGRLPSIHRLTETWRWNSHSRRVGNGALRAEAPVTCARNGLKIRRRVQESPCQRRVRGFRIHLKAVAAGTVVFRYPQSSLWSATC